MTVIFTCLSFARPLCAEGKNCVLLVNGHGKKSAGKNSIKKMKRLLKQLPDFLVLFGGTDDDLDPVKAFVLFEADDDFFHAFHSLIRAVIFLLPGIHLN